MSVPARSRGSAVARAQHSYAARHLLVPVQRFIHTESSSGFVLFAAAAVALAWANSPWGSSYESFWTLEGSLRLGPLHLSHSLREWINDALMVIFFFVVGLEVKREFVHGELSGWHRASLPVIAALGGMLVPAAIYAALNAGTTTAQGWGIPMATDIAFALGVLALVGDRIPGSLRIFLLALATVDDIGAILVIAIFYSNKISLVAIALAGLLILLILGMRRIGVQRVGFYAPVGVLFWFAVLESGIHATIAGVVLGLLTPTAAFLSRRKYADAATRLIGEYAEAERSGSRDKADALLGDIEEKTISTEAPADRLVRHLHPWSSYVVLPIFALANAGVVLTPRALSAAAASSEAYGILLGLGVGKVLGIMAFSYFAVRFRVASLLPGVRWTQMAGVGLLAGIGFTVSLFIADLAFANADNIAHSKAAILIVSVLSGILGYVALRTTSAAGSDSAR